VGNIAKQMLKQRLRSQQKQMRSSLRDIGRTKVYYPVRLNGSPVIAPLDRGDSAVQVAWIHRTMEDAEARSEKLSAILGEAGTPEPLLADGMQVKEYLHAIFLHLMQADLDLLVMENQEIPLTTMGVKVLQDEGWKGYLQEARVNPLHNVLLMKAARAVLLWASPEDKDFLTDKVTDLELKELILGKRGILPAVDLGIVWMLSAPAPGTDEVEPLFLKLKKDSPDNSTGQDLAIGPFFFSTREHALQWAQVLPANIAEHFSKVDMILDAYRNVGVLDEINENFPTAQIESKSPDIILLDGGSLPVTKAGAQYTDERNYTEGERPERTFSTIFEEGGTEALRSVVVYLAAQALGVRLQMVNRDGDTVQVKE